MTASLRGVQQPMRGEKESRKVNSHKESCMHFKFSIILFLPLRFYSAVNKNYIKLLPLNCFANNMNTE